VSMTQSDWSLLCGVDEGRERHSCESRVAHVAKPWPEKTRHKWAPDQERPGLNQASPGVERR
jgi:hypothetical protein